jgi:hypothetical protein
MKKKNLLKVLFLTIVLLGTNSMMAIEDGTLSEYCEWEYSSDPEVGNKNVLFTWETLPNGNVVISIAPGAGTDVATFRGDNGLIPGGYKVNGEQNTGNKYFSCSLNDDKTQITLVPQQSIPEGAEITHEGLMEWITSGSNNEYTYTAPFTTPYTYGTNCSGNYVQKLAKPTNVSVVDNVLTFDAVSYATGYIVTVSFGTTPLRSFTVAASGETMSSFPLSGTFDITVVATDDTGTYANSEASEPAVWNCAADDEPVGFSLVCEMQFGDAGWGLFISIETASQAEGDIQAGDILFTLSGTGAGFRAQGARLAAITVGGIAGANVLEKVSGNMDNPNVFRPIPGITINQGTPIVYNGEFEASSAVNNNIYGNRVFNYVYGTGCAAPPLDPPSNLVLDNNVLTFEPDPEAASTAILIMLGDETLHTINNFVSGSTIEFPINGSFTIKGRSMTGSSAYLNSEPSGGIALVVDIPDGTVGASEYCKWEFNPTGTGSAVVTADNPNDEPDTDIAYLTWTTDNNDIMIFLTGTSENATTTAFRPPAGFNVNNLRIGGLPAINLVTPDYGDKTVVFTPVVGISIPKGTEITYNGMVLYRVLGDTPNTELDNLYPTATFSYTYGAECPLGHGNATSDVSNEKISVYPNPATDILHFSSPAKEVQVYTLQGQSVLTAYNTSAVDVSGLSKGLYIVGATDENGGQTVAKVEVR